MNKKIRKLLQVIILCFSLCMVVGANDEVSAKSKKIVNNIKNKKIALSTGDTFSIKTDYKISNLTYSFSKKGIVTISKKGVITAKKKGTTTVTAKEKITGKKATFKVTVKQKETTSKKDDIVWCDDIAKKIFDKVKSNGTNDTNLNGTSFVTTKEHLTYIMSMCDKWVDGEYSEKELKTKLLSKDFEMFGGVTTVTSVQINKLKIKGNSFDAIYKEVIKNGFDGKHFIYIKISYDKAKDETTVYKVNGRVF